MTKIVPLAGWEVFNDNLIRERIVADLQERVRAGIERAQLAEKKDKAELAR